MRDHGDFPLQSRACEGHAGQPGLAPFHRIAGKDGQPHAGLHQRQRGGYLSHLDHRRKIQPRRLKADIGEAAQAAAAVQSDQPLAGQICPCDRSGGEGMGFRADQGHCVGQKDPPVQTLLGHGKSADADIGKP